MLHNNRKISVRKVLILLSCSLQACKFTKKDTTAAACIFELFQTGFSREHWWTTAFGLKKLCQAFSFTLAKFIFLHQQMSYFKADF